MTRRMLFLGALCASLVPLGTSPAGARTSPERRPADLGPAAVTQVVRLDRRPDLAPLFGTDLAGLRAIVAASLSRTATDTFGPITADVARRLGRAAYYGADDVEVWALPLAPGHPEEAGHSFTVIGVPKGTIVRPDGGVAPGPNAVTTAVGSRAKGGFSSNWDVEEVLAWTAFNVDTGGVGCKNTYGELRGQFEYSRLRGVLPWSQHDYWGFAAHAVAEITKRSPNCRNRIDWATIGMQSLTRNAYPTRQDPVTRSTTKCAPKVERVSGTFGGAIGSISQTIERCERWIVKGALVASAATWYTLTYDNDGLKTSYDRELGTLEIVRVPKGGGHGLVTSLGLDVDNG